MAGPGTFRTDRTIPSESAMRTKADADAVGRRLVVMRDAELERELGEATYRL